ncbi:AAWKG family protein [Streptomyces sp. NA02950]|uniref:AAWKG family protein n=1 Tax=Streptomyces sp. NA02950 TaxID=2742137 RepID=UPI001590039D|nr:AAWKG family protein [Streptomyces sp. NA02950]QKV96025.1 AAWKG family protein [Streptomyces sp. NA02950]
MATNNDDNWKHAVDMLTGYVLPEQETVITALTGNEGIPLMHVRLERIQNSKAYPEFISLGGWRKSNTDFVFPYFRHDEDGQRDVSVNQDWVSHYIANITFLGRSGGADSIPSGSDSYLLEQHTSGVLQKEGMWNHPGEGGTYVSYDTTALERYVNGSYWALHKLVFPEYSTQGYEDRGIAVPDDGYVDLRSFTEVAMAFDRAAKFMVEAADAMLTWDSKDIGKGSKSWDGTGANIFKEFVHKMGKNYEEYADRVSGGKYGYIPTVSIDGVTVGSPAARAIIDLQNVLYNEAVNLHNAWAGWRPESNPYRWLYDMLMDGFQTSFSIQHDQIAFSGDTGKPGSGTYTYALPGFENTVRIYGTDYGPPNEASTWKLIGEEAVKKWQTGINNWLGNAAEHAIVAIQDAMGNAADALKKINLQGAGGISLSTIADKEAMKKEKNDAKAAQDDLLNKQNKAQEDLLNKQRDEQNKAAKAQDELLKAQKAAQDEAARAQKAAQDEAARAQKAAQDSAARAQKEQEEAQEKAQAQAAAAQKEQQDEAARAQKAAQDSAARAQKEQEEAQEKAQAQAAAAQKEQQDEAARAQKAAQADSTAAQAKAQAQNEADRAQAEADRQQQRADQKKAQAEALARQDKASADAEAARNKAQAQNEADRAQAKNDAAAQAAAATRLAEQQQAEAKKDRAEQKAQEKKASADAEAAQKKAEAQNEADRAQAEADRQQQQADQKRAEAEALARQDKASADAEAAQKKAEAQNEADRAQAEADRQQQQADQKRAEAEALARQDKASADAEAAQKKAQAQADQARQEALRNSSEASADAEQAKADAKADLQHQFDDARSDRDAAEQAADRKEADAKREFEQHKAEAEAQRDQAEQQADRARAEARHEIERQVASGQLSPEQGQQELHQRLDQINAAEQDAKAHADAAEAEAKEEYDHQRAQAEADRNEARANAEQARRDARAAYDQRMGDIRADYDRAHGDGKNIEDLIRQRIADLPQSPGVPSQHAGANSPYAASFSDNLYNQDDLAHALGGEGADGSGISGQPGSQGASPGMFPPPMRGMGGGESGSSSGERTRNVLETGVTRPSRGISPAPTVEEEEHQIAPRGVQTTSNNAPFMPPMGGMPGGGEQQTQSGDRVRNAWLTEDEDVWGAEGGGAPQALGR